MKKHILKLSLIALLGFGLFACGNDDTSSASSTPASSNTESSSSSSSAASSSSSSSKASSSSSSSSSSSAISSATEEVKLSKVSEVKTIAKGKKVKFRATYQGKNNKVFKDSKLGDVWFGAYVADGDDWMQLFKTNKDLITNDINIGDVIEVEGTTAHYTNSNVTTPEVSATSIKKVTDATITAGNWLTFNETNHPALTNEMLNKGAHIENALVTNVDTSSSGNKTIYFKLVDTTYQIHLNKNYTDITIDSIANLAENDTFSCDTYVSVSSGKYQFALANNFTSVKGEKVNVTGVTADAEVEVNVGFTKKITASVEPSNATVKGLTYVSNNTEIATVDENGNVKGVAKGSTTITITSVDDTTKSATVNVTVTTPTIDSNSVKYDFKEINDPATSGGAVELTAEQLLTIFNDCTIGNANIESLSNLTKVFKARESEAAGLKGIKVSTSKVNGKFTMTLNRAVSKVEIEFSSWSDTTASKIDINGVSHETKSKTQYETLTYDIEDATSLTFSATNRLVIGSITLHFAKEKAD